MAEKVCFVSIDVEDDIKDLDKILDVLKRYNVPATLFVTGKLIEEYGGLVKLWSENYEIACHSFTHRFWNKLNYKEREREIDDFIDFYQRIFNKKPKGFRAPSHVIDKEALSLLTEKGFLYDSSVVPHYPPFKKYRGYQGKKPLLPYYPKGLKILEIPCRGQIFGIPLAGAWIKGLPLWFYQALFLIHRPGFMTLSMHSWDALNSRFPKKLEKILKILKNKNYQFLDGEQLFENYK